MRTCVVPKRPSRAQWNVLNLVVGERCNPMELDDFTRIWDVSREELAFICGCSVDTVNNWYSPARNSRPSEKHKQRLAIAHYWWTTKDSEPEFFQELSRMYERRPRRRSA